MGIQIFVGISSVSCSASSWTWGAPISTRNALITKKKHTAMNRDLEIEETTNVVESTVFEDRPGALVHYSSIQDKVILHVGGVHFVLDPCTIEMMNSEFLRALVNADSKFKNRTMAFTPWRQTPSVSRRRYICMARYGSLPTPFVWVAQEEAQLRKEAAFWGCKVRSN